MTPTAQTYKGLPVPYVAIWELERIGPQLAWEPTGLRILDNPHTVRYGPSGPGGYSPVLWLDTPHRQGGPGNTPNFGGTHSNRQRMCMQQGRCQVCGNRKRHTDLLWIVPYAEDQFALKDNHSMILNPPVCGQCFKLALSVCPHLIKYGDKARIYRGKPRITGVHGTLVHEGNRTEIVYLKNTNPALRHTLGRQFLVTLEDEKEQELEDVYHH